jgi:hypothetical protein
MPVGPPILQPIPAANIDLTTFDPKPILASIALDERQPGNFRVAACRAYAALAAGGAATKKERALQSLNARAIQLMNGYTPLVH